MAKEVKLLGNWPSPFAMRPLIALHMKSVEYEYIVETTRPKGELLLRSNPVHKKIPVLVHNDKAVCESLIIVEYIDEAFPSSGLPIMPSNPYDRTVNRFWAAYIDGKWFPSFYDSYFGKDEETRSAAFEKVKEGLEVIEDAFIKCSKGKAFFNGDKLGYLDITFGCFVGWLRVVGKAYNTELLNVETTPNLLAWAERFCADDAVKEYMPETDKLLEFGNMIKAEFEAAASS